MLNQQELFLMRVLKRHVGKANAIKADDLVGKIGVLNDGKTQAPTRSKVLKLMKEMRIPIASCNKGYFIPSTVEEVAEYTQHLFGRIAGIRKRINFFRKAARRLDQQRPGYFTKGVL